MLSDSERATWDQIQDRFLAQNPGFAQTFDAPARRFPDDVPRRRRSGEVALILSWVAVSLGVVMLLFGSVGEALLVAVVGLALWMACG